MNTPCVTHWLMSALLLISAGADAAEDILKPEEV